MVVTLAQAADARPAAGSVGASEALPSVACLVHIFYPALWPELARYIGNFGEVPLHLRVNIVESVAHAEIVRRIRADFPHALIRISPNRGRDIGGYFALMQDLDFDAHTVICLMHTKRSPHIWFGGGRRWRRALLDAILADRQRAQENVAAFLHDPGLGLIGAARWRSTDLTVNARHYAELLDRLGIRAEHRQCEFLAGSIMLVRASVMRRLYAALKDAPFEQDANPAAQRDGLIEHAIERVIGNVVRDMGLRMLWR